MNHHHTAEQSAEERSEEAINSLRALRGKGTVQERHEQLSKERALKAQKREEYEQKLDGSKRIDLSDSKVKEIMTRNVGVVNDIKKNMENTKDAAAISVVKQGVNVMLKIKGKIGTSAVREADYIRKALESFQDAHGKEKTPIEKLAKLFEAQEIVLAYIDSYKNFGATRFFDSIRAHINDTVAKHKMPEQDVKQAEQDSEKGAKKIVTGIKKLSNMGEYKTSSERKTEAEEKTRKMSKELLSLPRRGQTDDNLVLMAEETQASISELIPKRTYKLYKEIPKLASSLRMFRNMEQDEGPANVEGVSEGDLKRAAIRKQRYSGKAEVAEKKLTDYKKEYEELISKREGIDTTLILLAEEVGSKTSDITEFVIKAKAELKRTDPETVLKVMRESDYLLKAAENLVVSHNEAGDNNITPQQKLENLQTAKILLDKCYNDSGRRDKEYVQPPENVSKALVEINKQIKAIVASISQEDTHAALKKGKQNAEEQAKKMEELLNARVEVKIDARLEQQESREIEAGRIRHFNLKPVSERQLADKKATPRDFLAQIRALGGKDGGTIFSTMERVEAPGILEPSNPTAAQNLASTAIATTADKKSETGREGGSLLSVTSTTIDPAKDIGPTKEVSIS